MSNGKYFSPNEAIAMTPLVVSYCHSLYYVVKREERRSKILFSLYGLISASPKKNKKIGQLIDKMNARSICDLKKTSEWIIEIHRLGWQACKSLSHIDIPVWDDDLQRSVYLCFSKDTKADYVWWHEEEEDGSKVRPYFYKIIEKKSSKARKMPQ